MTMIEQTRVREMLDYDPETGVFRRKTAWRRGRAVGASDGRYLVMSIDRRKVYLHRLAWLYMTGRWPENKIDHINGDPADNRFSNLREASDEINSQNLRSAKARNATGLLGVSRKRHRYEARIYFAGRQVRLGVFDAPEEAHSAYVEAKRKFHEGCEI